MATGGLRLTQLLRPNWRLLLVAFAAMLVQAASDVLEPWPLKIVFDHVLGSKRVPPWLSAWMADGHDRIHV
jgi:ABC-type multidrug transport system fused ATPase/permease subunit